MLWSTAFATTIIVDQLVTPNSAQALKNNFLAICHPNTEQFFSIPALRNNRKAFVSFIPKTLIERICKSEKITLGSDHK